MYKRHRLNVNHSNHQLANATVTFHLVSCDGILVLLRWILISSVWITAELTQDAVWCLLLSSTVLQQVTVDFQLRILKHDLAALVLVLD